MNTNELIISSEGGPPDFRAAAGGPKQYFRAYRFAFQIIELRGLYGAWDSFCSLLIAASVTCAKKVKAEEPISQDFHVY